IRAKKLCYGRPDAEDLVQDVLAKYVTSFKDGQLPSEQGSMAWLATALKNAFISRLRKERVHLRVEPDPALQEALAPEPADQGKELLSESVTDEELAEAFQSLSLKQRQVFEASVRGLRYAEIARQLGIKEGAVAKRLFDARKRLRAKLLEI